MKPTRFIGKHFLDYFTYQAHRRKPKPREDVRCVQKIIYEKNLDIGARHVPLCVVSFLFSEISFRKNKFLISSYFFQIFDFLSFLLNKKITSVYVL